MHDRRVYLAQNFIVRPGLAASLLAQSSIGKNDVVYEVGPGRGALTGELVRKAKRVIAVEKDYHLYARLKDRFKYHDNLILHCADFLEFKIREPRYKVFSNLPFNITAAAVRKLVRNPRPPSEAYLIMQREAAERFIGAPRATRFSVCMLPWFSTRIVRHFRKTDFTPLPAVDVVMIHIERRAFPLVPSVEIQPFERFVAWGFGAWRRNMKLNYKHVFSHKQWKRISRDLGFDPRCRPSELTGPQWLGLYGKYHFFLRDRADRHEPVL